LEKGRESGKEGKGGEKEGKGREVNEKEGKKRIRRVETRRESGGIVSEGDGRRKRGKREKT
jgi:hypothetical protein